MQKNNFENFFIKTDDLMNIPRRSQNLIEENLKDIDPKKSNQNVNLFLLRDKLNIRKNLRIQEKV